MIRKLLVAVLALGGSAVVAATPLPERPAPEMKGLAIQSAEIIGRQIYRHDRAAAVATDAALALGAFRDEKRVQGWITEERPGSIVVTFIDGTPAALYRVAVADDGTAGEVEALEAPTALSPYEAGAAAARAAALESDFQPCSDRYNTVVLRAAADRTDKWVVYLLPATTRNGVVPIGGTYRVGVEGSRVTSQRAFTRSCIALRADPQAAAMMITHLLDEIPTEAHVFWSTWAGKPMYVATGADSVWLVNGGEISQLDLDGAGDRDVDTGGSE